MREVYFRAKYNEDDVFRSGDLDIRQFVNNRLSLPSFIKIGESSHFIWLI